MPLSIKGNFLMNVLVAITCAVTCAEAVKTLVVSKPANASAARAAKAPPLGGKFSLAGIDWSRSSVTVLLAVSRNCPYCSSSVPFYRRLFDAASSTGVPIVLLTQDGEIEKTREYFETLNLRASDLHQVSLGELGIRATPTMLMVDSSGTVRRAWAGILRNAEESDAIALVSARADKRRLH
jgi:hypothetical protein